MIIRLQPTYIYLFMEAQNAQPFSLECTKEKLLILKNIDTILVYLRIDPCITFTYIYWSTLYIYKSIRLH